MDDVLDQSDYKYAIKGFFKGHTSDVRVVKAARYPVGGFITGSRDSLVKLWVPSGENSFKDEHVFIGARKFIASLCALPPSTQYPDGLILAGSNDCSIYGFTINSQNPVMRLRGHSDAVCTLSAGFGLFVSGSWDGTARVWSGQQCTAVLEGHNQTVWATEVYPLQNMILTGSADHTIRVWRHGVCENVLYGHTDCVRGLVVKKDLNILSCSNDTTVRLWNIQGECLNIFQGHDNYIYSITLLKNGIDFATCGEDEQVVIWKGGRWAQSLSIALKTLWSIACLDNGDLAVGCSDGSVCLLGKATTEEIAESGDKTNIETAKSINGYEWNAKKNKWVKTKSEKCGESSIKTELDLLDKPAKDKDFEFYVDIEGKLCKLELNKNEDPYDVAMKFIAEHTLDPSHLTEILSYIIRNCASKLPPGPNEYFPLENYYTYLNANVAGLKAKLLEFTGLVSKSHHVPPAKIENLVLLASFPEEVNEEQMQCLDKVITWKDEYLFPALDLIRLAVRCKSVGARIGNTLFVDHLIQILRSSKLTVNHVLAIKIFCNLFDEGEGEQLMIKNQAKICEAVKDAVYFGEKTHKSSSSMFLNYAVAAYKGLTLDVELYCANLVEIMKVIQDSDSLYRLFVAVGTLCNANYSAFVYLSSLNMREILVLSHEHVEAGRAYIVLKILLEGFESIVV